MRSAVDHVQHRHGQHVGVGAADPPVERHSGLGGGRLGRRERHSENRVGSQAGLVLRAVKRNQSSVDRALIGSVEAGQRRADLLPNVADRLLDAFAEVRLGVAVTELDGLVLAGRCSGRHGRASDLAGAELHLDLDSRVAAGIEDLSSSDSSNLCAHSSSLARSK